MELQNIQSGSYNIQSGIKTASDSSTQTVDSTQTSNTQSSSASAIQQQTDKLTQKTQQEDLKKELMKLTEDLNKEMNPLNVNVKFGYEDKINEMYVSVYEKDSNKLLRKIPSDEAISLMAKMREIIGIIFDKKA